KEKNWLLIRKRDEAAEAVTSATHKPMLATPESDLPRGDGWVFEVKWGGYRALAYVRGGECRLVSRDGNDLTQSFASVARAVVKALKTPNAVIDGEVCALDEAGRPSFGLLQAGAERLVYYAFDELEADGESLVALPLVERQERLRELIDKRNATVKLSEAFDDGEALLGGGDQQHPEGGMAKGGGPPDSGGGRTR